MALEPTKKKAVRGFVYNYNIEGKRYSIVSLKKAKAWNPMDIQAELGSKLAAEALDPKKKSGLLVYETTGGMRRKITDRQARTDFTVLFISDSLAKMQTKFEAQLAAAAKPKRKRAIR